MSKGNHLGTKRFIFLCLLAIGTVGASESARADDSSSNRPNIIVILCDDLGYADVGFNGAKDIRTPHLDTLAAQGTICSSAYVAHPFCGPSRMGLMTGRYPHSIGGQYNLPPSRGDMTEGIPVSET